MTWFAGWVPLDWEGRAVVLVGLGLAAGAVAVPITWYALVWPQPVTLFGWHLTVPMLWGLSHWAGVWIPLGVGLGLMGTGLLAIRRPPRSDEIPRSHP